MNHILKAIVFCALFTGLFVRFSMFNTAPETYKRLVHGLIGTAAAFITTFIFLRSDKKSFAAIGLQLQRSTLPKFFAGILMGTGIMGALVMGVLYFTHTGVELNPQANMLRFLWATIALLPLAFMEELGFRAYPLRLLQDTTGIRLAIFITSVLFALYHIANGWTVRSSFYGPAVWGLLFGIAAVYSKGIALPTGIHYAANLTTAAFSENANAQSLFIIHPAAGAGAADSQGDWTVIGPSILLLIVSVLCIELYMRRRKVV